MIRLPDVNLLLALAWRHHVHHETAHRWLHDLRPEKWASCPLTQNGFVRISSNPSFIPDAVSPLEAAEVLGKFMSHPEHVFVPEDLPLPSEHFNSMFVTGHRQVSDAYLLSLCIEKKIRLSTLDTGIKSLLPVNSVLHRHLETVRTAGL